MPQPHIKLKVRIPQILIDARGADPALIEALTPGLKELDARVRVLGEGAEGLKHIFSIEDAMEETHMWVVLGSQLPKEFSMLVKHGIVPVMKEDLHTDAENYDPIKESGNAFLFDELNAWRVYAALVRGIENFAFSHDWENLRKEGKVLAKD